MIEIRADQRTFDAVARALDEEAQGHQLRDDLARDLHEALAPAVDEVRTALLAHGGSALPDQEPLLPTIAAAVVIDAGVRGRSARARIRALKSGMPRNFPNAPKRFNETRFRRRVFGRTWVYQVGAPGWFDRTLHRDQDKYRAAVERAMERVVRRITRRV